MGDETSSRGDVPDAQLEAYLDGLLTGQERAAMEARVASEPELKRQAELQRRINAGLERLFRVETPVNGRLAAHLMSARRKRDAPAARPAKMWWAAAVAAVAAAIAWALVGAPLQRGRLEEPLFAARPLADVYRETVAEGFEPYYECREADRFAETFALRQGLPLKLLPLGSGAEMLGLSYPGGLSRDTTAMLCRVDGEPVMVFVDRASADKPAAMDHADASLRVFRDQRDGLVFYEVTPLAQSRVTASMVRVDD
jgi:anti-sigma-K factor RskA